MTIHTSSDYDFSVRRAVVEAWKKFALHWRTYLRYLWPFLLMAGIGAGLFAVALSMYLTQHAIPCSEIRTRRSSGLGAAFPLVGNADCLSRRPPALAARTEWFGRWFCLAIQAQYQ